jgi:hypothetical protein
MQIDFYEEFPTKENLEKLKLVKWKTRIFVAAKSLEEFQNLEKQIKKIKKNAEVAYWPIIPNSYWISPFSNTRDLIKIFEELDSIKNPLLIDLELPLRRIDYIFKNLPHLGKNKKIIRDFLERNKSRVTTAESPLISIQNLLRLIGLNYDIDYERSIMFYTSTFSKWWMKKTKNFIQKGKYNKESPVSLGAIAIGIMGDEPILSPENLEKDLEFCKKEGFKKIIIFRLGGLNEKYLKIIKEFAK